MVCKVLFGGIIYKALYVILTYLKNIQLSMDVFWHLNTNFYSMQLGFKKEESFYICVYVFYYLNTAFCQLIHVYRINTIAHFSTVSISYAP